MFDVNITSPMEGEISGQAQSLVGIFSVSQIARQLGIPIQTHERARTFAELEALIAHA